jgi:hypothetical protein
VGLWGKIRGFFVREDEPSFAQDEPPVSSVQYPKLDPPDDRVGGESADEQREGEGFR